MKVSSAPPWHPATHVGITGASARRRRARNAATVPKRRPGCPQWQQVIPPLPGHMGARWPFSFPATLAKRIQTLFLDVFIALLAI